MTLTSWSNFIHKNGFKNNSTGTLVDYVSLDIGERFIIGSLSNSSYHLLFQYSNANLVNIGEYSQSDIKDELIQLLKGVTQCQIN